jgi:hypothetical protein
MKLLITEETLKSWTLRTVIGRSFPAKNHVIMKLFFLYNPSTEIAEILDSMEMTSSDALRANVNLRKQNSDNRWVAADRWDDDVEYANGPADEYYQDDISDCT